MIARPELVGRVTAGLEQSPVTLILGPRQCGKTTLARQLGQNQEGSYYVCV
jgi:predicted AAA+ superfamily ATPase